MAGMSRPLSTRPAYVRGLGAGSRKFRRTAAKYFLGGRHWRISTAPVFVPPAQQRADPSHGIQRTTLMNTPTHSQIDRSSAPAPLRALAELLGSADLSRVGGSRVALWALLWASTSALAAPPDRDTEGPGQGENASNYQRDRDTEGPGQGELRFFRITDVDLRFARKLRLAQHEVQWQSPALGTPLALTARDALCELPLSFEIKNAGPLTSANFQIRIRQLAGNSTPGTPARTLMRSKIEQAGLAGGSQRWVRTMLSLHPGHSRLLIELDPAMVVQEIDESNNEAELALDIDAECRLSLRRP